MKGQISLEFLIIFVAYLTFLFVLIAAFGYVKEMREYEEKISLKAKGELLSLIYSLRTINNKFQWSNISSEGCGILEEEIICGEVEVKRKVPKMIALRYGYEIV